MEFEKIKHMLYNQHMLQLTQKWLLIFYTVPAKPVSNRMQIWRRLSQIGALQLKGAVYVLPYQHRLFEFATELIKDVKRLGGDGFFVSACKIEGIADDEIVRLFNEQIEQEYLAFSKSLEKVELLLNRLELKDKGVNFKKLKEQVERLFVEFQSINEHDYYESPKADEILQKITTLKQRLDGVAKDSSDDKHDDIQVVQIPKVNANDFKARLWVTRPRPFVDRIASAWLIKRFIDEDAQFGFVDGQSNEHSHLNAVGFDMQGGVFSHVGLLCTFEVLIKAFQIKAKGMKKLSEIVHQIDLADDVYKHPEASGLQTLLTGLRNSEKDDHNILQKGIWIMDMFYEAIK
ncbi:MAG: chromate resistance protein [Thermodesulfovibrionales bacterium]|nr:chromate resistance protein [Thermodesulfovibrionales bacterium]